MCGLIAIKRFDGLPVSKMVEKRYKRQITRGTEGFGFVSMKGGVFEDFRKSELEQPILAALREQKGDEVMFHHRRPTSTENIWEAAHPIQVTHPDLKHDYYVIHNGSLRDYEKLYAEHEKQGFQYTTLFREALVTQTGRVIPKTIKWNDSETYAIELVKDLDKNQTGLPHLSGNIAFICIQVEKTTQKAVKLFWGRNMGSPLKVEKNNRYLVISSEGSGGDITAHELHSYEYSTGKLDKKNYIVGYSTTASTYSGSPTYNDDFFKTHHWDYRERKYVPDVPKIESPKAADPVGDVDLEKMIELENQIKEIDRQIKDDVKDPADLHALRTLRTNLKTDLDVFEKKYPTIGMVPDPYEMGY